MKVAPPRLDAHKLGEALNCHGPYMVDVEPSRSLAHKRQPYDYSESILFHVNFNLFIL